MRVTKRPKHVNVYYEKIESSRSVYTCPVCKGTFIGFSIDKTIIRFRCKCGQELIIDKHKDKP
jgi:hypothetical protein